MIQPKPKHYIIKALLPYAGAADLNVRSAVVSKPMPRTEARIDMRIMYSEGVWEGDRLSRPLMLWLEEAQK